MTGDSPRRVLIADDDAGIRRLLTVTLRKEGYDTADACDGREALEAMRSGSVDLVLLDLMMPNVTGWDVLEQRDAAPALLKIPVIVITAARGDGIDNIPNDGMCALLTKPFELDTLHALVKACLNRT